MVEEEAGLPGRRKRAPSNVLGVDVSCAETPYATDGDYRRAAVNFFPERHAGGLTGGSGSKIRTPSACHRS
jgi:hypothetical protein